MSASTTLCTNQLYFFNKNGDLFNFKYTNGIWTGKIYLPEVSVGLLENETIYIVEKLKVGNSIVYGLPHVPNAATANPLWTASMDPSGASCIRLFNIDNPTEQEPMITLATTATYGVIDDISTMVDGDGYLVAGTPNIPHAVKINVCINSSDEGAYSNTLTISDENGVLAVIGIYGETVGEDERFNVLLSNFGEQLLASDEFIFRTSDISEQLPDYKLLNRKRKELFIEYSNIIPYLASYKGIINILKFFDYYDIQLKEYWYNPLTKKRTSRDIELNEYKKLSSAPETPSYPYQKTCQFGLFYDINELTGDYDADGVPITKLTDNYSQEEVLIKLFGLKNYIYRRNIGGISRITDIIGQALYFSKYRLNSWHDRVEMVTVERNIHPTFTISNTSGYIQDVRSELIPYGCTIPRDITALTGGTYRVWELSTCWTSYFNNVNTNYPDLIEDSSEDIPVGFPVVLTNTTFDTTWAECHSHWADCDNIMLPVNWNTIGAQDYYDVEWKLVYKPSVDVDIRSYTKVIRGSLESMASLSVILPFSGSYDVVLTLYGYNGLVSRHTEIGCINVQLKQPDFMAFYKIYDARIQSWNTAMSWAESDSHWNRTKYDTTNFPVEFSPLNNRSLSPVPYFRLLDNYDDRRIGYREIWWNDFDNSWSNFEFNTWAEMSPIYGKPAHFKITSILPYGEVQIDDEIFGTNYGIADFAPLSTFLQTLGRQTSILQRFDYNFVARPFDTPIYVDAVSNSDGVNGNVILGGTSTIETDKRIGTWAEADLPWSAVPIIWNNAYVIYEAIGIDEPFTKDNIRYFIGHFDVPITVPVFFTYDNSGIPGKTLTRWIISATDTGEIIADVTAPRLIFRFTKEGDYDIQCTITDTSSNSATVKRTSCVSVLLPDDWKNLHPY